MKYVLMYTSEPTLLAEVDPEKIQEVYGKVYAWFQEHGAVMADSGAELQGVETATTVKHGGVVVDGPFNEAKEVVGGFSVLDVPDLDDAIALVKTWPSMELPGIAIEIRPMVTDYSQFE